MTDATEVKKTRLCLKCRQTLPLNKFPPARSIFFPAKRSYICVSCLEESVPADNWDAVDGLMRWLNLPFDIEQWTRLYKTNKQHTFTAYLNIMAGGEYSTTTWKTENEKWRTYQTEQTFADHVEDMRDAKLAEMRKRWSDSYTYEEYVWLDNLYKQITATQNVSTPILQDYAKDYCEISLRIKKRIREGEDVKKEMDSRDNIIKIAGFEAKNAINVSDFDSVGELITYYVKKGWMPDWNHEDKDTVDFTMHNIQQYLKRLVVNEGGLAGQVEQRREAYNTAMRLEEDQLESDDDLHRYEESDDNIQYEGEQELDYELSD